ncbi:EAL domain-containing protein (putative c-di-GMP-specific phosphodiesterase class I) [Anoxybacillus tepidamans]|uniref:EAL domain-containing protein (Putative c-di-GMP-specific phosphodiesterase class I) n=1 Tax=Anoxybacteroides tepidamans TaxID=265948 RepID=A0A7W8IUJ1_9BACL|nr:EAL domain-containing protein [Anoxybacillus tepidamans]MBB5326131.1 EAL domain-containing protein (putative c-di-GMP-specific phosphodiesterase class I) [Anoxybacillus tepidamans]
MENKKTVREIIVNHLFTNVFQPIYQLSNIELVGYESLLRCPFVKSPDELFMNASERGDIYNLDIASIANSLKDFAAHYKNDYPYNIFLSLNVYPSTIAMPFFPQVLEQLVKNVSLFNQQIILEINESEKIENFDKMLRNIHILKELGFLVALDDLGKGEYSLQSLLEIAPQVIKLDRYFAKGLAGDVKKQRAISSIVQFFSENTKIILEGIETEEDLRCAKLLGVPYGQGYYLAKPQRLNKAK